MHDWAQSGNRTCPQVISVRKSSGYLDGMDAPKVRLLVPDVAGLMTHGFDRMNAVLITVGTRELNHTKLKSLACVLLI